ncbi:hypothetical protein [Bradyrhizobium sp. BR 10261]|uniref:hypothetical protein n=1 Tax=Bradyrhizobium sp. BR 10261 TaxID=2749992 RepID=UPI001C6522F4|nr:hypothetical protein [Bradyrhizobium sp. BR 10261]MBW7961801.1 hypothetical protein [Bradyrhizobium sp. BR 10261]
MDLEIQQAAFAGLDYWAFVAYGNDDPMSIALSRYLSSSYRAQVKFCLFTELTLWGSAGKLSPIVAEHIELMKRPEYVRTNDGRPLYFLGFIDQNKISERWGTHATLREQISSFRKDAVAAGVGNPYLVLAGTFSELTEWASLGGDALGAYAISDIRGVGPYESLTKLTEQRWKAISAAGLPVVPTVMTGWDRRPRVEHPVPWEHSQKVGQGIDYYFGAATPLELVEHLDHALKYVAEQTSIQRAPTVLIYAWNENDEGGWLVPTIPCDTGRLQALHHFLRSNQDLSLNPRCTVRSP